jgi:hypothetical protein
MAVVESRASVVFVLMARLRSRLIRICSRLFPILSLIAHAACAADQIQIVSGGNRLTAGPDGTLFMLGSGQIDATPGAYLTSPPYYTQDFLRRLDPVTGRLLYATYLDFYTYSIFIDAQGAAYLYGISQDPQFSISPGAYDRHITGGEQLVVAKLNPSGTAMEFVTLLGGSGYPYGENVSGGIAAGPDGAVYVVGNTCSKDFPTTPDAFSRFSANRCSSSTILESPSLQPLQLGSENPEKRL